MRFFLISDNQDTLHGLRLSGIEGAYVTERQDALAALQKCLADPEIAIVLITGRIKSLCVKEVYAVMLERSFPLIVEIPEAGEVSRSQTGILDYIRDAIGLRI
jgi:V/A-type H+-transporting ATPase subunit F